MGKIKRKAKILTLTALTAAVVFMGTGWGVFGHKLQEANAAVQLKDTVEIRIINTTDLHGQLNSKDYEQGVDYNNGGLARVYDLIQTARGELPKENTVILDAGDVLYDYTTEYIFSENQEAIQPIYKAMAKIGYDAITLGNHDFDYGYDYIQKQLNGSGLRDITVVSNVVDSRTGEYPFLENKLITRKVKTASGKEVEVKIGIIGLTIPTLTSKTHSYVGILKTEDMVENAKKEAIKLKEMGADIIIALSHTGIGPVDPELNFKNVAYALSEIPEIDVVVCGHEHNLFPTNDMTSPIYKLPGVDKKTFLMNGKNVIMAGNRGKAIGVVDLTLEVTGDSVVITNRNSEVKLVTAENTREDKSIAALYGDWEDKLSEYSTEIIGELKKGAIIQNYYGLLGDNSAIQLLNDSKIDYALRYVNTTGKSYQSYPIIAASTYASYGVASVNDFINIHDKITEWNLSTLQPYNNYLYLYSITGKQLREWLEWSASAYETTSGSTLWTDKTMSDLIKTSGLKSLISEAWLNDWSSFYIFDGIDYVMDPSVEPRYDLSGNRINSTRRIQNILYNGKEVTDTTVLLIATDKITQPTDANNGIDKQVVLNGFIRGQVILSKYIEKLTESGSILPQIDNNWRVKFPLGYSFLVKAPNYADELFKNTTWYVDNLLENNQYRYYKATYPVVNEDLVSPHLVASPIIVSATASPYEVAVQVSDASEIKLLRYMIGDYNLEYTGWPVASKLLYDRTFTISENGSYSIYAEDIYGNKTVKKLVINNFSDNLLSKPTAITYTNRKTKISGTAEPGTKIVFEAYTGTYESKVDNKGNYSYALPSQPSGTAVLIYIKDEVKGLVSERLSVLVKRTGPNQPSINPIYNNMSYISGNTHDGDASVIAIIDDTVYVSDKGGKELYENDLEIYKKELKIVEIHTEVFDTGYYMMLLPPQEAGKQVTVYSIDHLSRNSRLNTASVEEVAPNSPQVYEVSNIEKSLNGYVPDSKGVIYDITLTVGDKTFHTLNDKYGRFSFQLEDQLHADQILSVAVSDIKNGTVRISAPAEVKVKDIESFVRENSTILLLNKTTSKSLFIIGNFTDKGTVYLAISSGEGETFKNTFYTLETDEYTKFRYQLEGKLEVGAKIYVMTRFTDGKILLANKTVVLPGRPDIPALVKDMTNVDKSVQVIANKDCEVALTIGSKVYTSTIYQYDELTGQYIYSFITDRGISGTMITVVATNVSGISDAFTSQIKKAAPDRPIVNTVSEGDKLIAGTVELLEYIPPTQTGTTIDIKVPDKFKEAPAKVAKTQTRIFASIGKKTYEGTIDKDGDFKIKIPAQTAGTEILVWGTNKAGRGPLIKVVVSAK